MSTFYFIIAATLTSLGNFNMRSINREKYWIGKRLFGANALQIFLLYNIKRFQVFHLNIQLQEQRNLLY